MTLTKCMDNLCRMKYVFTYNRMYNSYEALAVHLHSGTIVNVQLIVPKSKGAKPKVGLMRIFNMQGALCYQEQIVEDFGCVLNLLKNEYRPQPKVLADFS